MQTYKVHILVFWHSVFLWFFPVANRMAVSSEYTSYILALQGILAEAQSLILRLSRGYKTASRLDQEWRDKMKSVVKEVCFMSIVAI